MKGLRHLPFALTVFLVCAIPSFSQTGNATLSGTIHDARAAVIPSAKVAVKNTLTGVSTDTVSNAAGLYVFTSLVPGRYVLDVTAPGFAPKEVSGIVLNVDQQAALDVELAVGEVNQKVTVTEAPPMLQTEDASVGTVIQSQQVVSLPLNGRFFTQLLELVPGAQASVRATGMGSEANSTNPQTDGKQRNGMPEFDVNGQAGGTVYFRIDGIENTEREFGGANIPISVDAIQEFKLQTANFSAEIGRGPSAVDVVTKGGTNQYHGVLFEFLRNTDLDATEWAYTGPHGLDNLKRNQFGGSIGGPIKKDKLFWFFNFDGTREIYTAPQTVTVPTQAMRNGVFPAGEVVWDWMTQAPFPNNTVPSARLDPIMQKVLGIVPQPNLPGLAVTNAVGLPLPSTNNYFYDPAHTQNINQYTGRVDYTISQKDSVFGRYTYSPNTLVGDGPLATNIQGSIVGYEIAHLGGTNMSAGWLRTFSPTTVNSLRFGFETDPQNYAKGDTTDYAKQFGYSQFLYPGYFTGLADFRIGSLVMGSGDYRPLQVSERNFEWADDVTLVRGHHTIKIGMDVRKTNLLTNNAEYSSGRFYFNGSQTRNRANGASATTPCVGASGNCTNGDATADFLLGYLDFFQAGQPISGKNKFFSTWAPYINDTWKISNKLTATIGLRYEYLTRWHSDPPAYALQNVQNYQLVGIAVPDPGGKITSAVPQANLALAPNQVVGCSTIGLPSNNCLKSYKFAFQPRLGFAYSVTPKTVVRLGAGFFYDALNGDLDTEDGEQWPNINNTSTPTYTAPPTGTAPPPITMQNPTGTTTTPIPFEFSSLPNRKPPKTIQWNLTVEHQFAGDMTLSVAYVGILGRDLENTQEWCCYYDMPQPWGVVLAPGQKQVQPDPTFSPISLMWEDNVSSNYNALQVALKKRFSHGLTFQASGTYSKNLNTIPWIIDPRFPVQSVAGNDVTNQFSFSPIYELPFGKGKAFLNNNAVLNQIVGGWQLSGIWIWRSGFPFTPTLSGVNLLNITKDVASDNMPNAVCSGSISNPTPVNWYNKNCFTTPVEPTTPGAMLVDGNLGLNALRGPSNLGVDFGATKQFELTERFKLDFRFEAFNVLNHPMFNTPNAAIVPGNNAPANITTLVSLPRTLQFALKLNF